MRQTASRGNVPVLRRSDNLTSSCWLQPASTRPPWAYDCAKGCTDVSPGGDFTCAQQASGQPIPSAATHHLHPAMHERFASCSTDRQTPLLTVMDSGRQKSTTD